MPPLYALLAVFLCSPLFAQDAVSVSRYVFIAGQAADIASSYGRTEANPMLRSADGDFRMRGLACKSSLTVAILVAQRAPWFRQHRKFTIALNLAGVGVSAFATAHNYRMR